MRDHGNSVFGSLLNSRSIAEVSKMPGGKIRVMVTTEDACQHVDCQPETKLEEKQLFWEFDTLDTRYYRDVFVAGV